MNPSLPTRVMRAQPDLVQLKRQAKELLEAFHAGEAGAIAEVRAHDRGARADAFALHDAQRVLARAYGFPSWPKLKAFVDGATVRRLAEVVRRGDLPQARSLLRARPELARMALAEDDERQALHFAVMERRPEMVRLLLAHGADPHQGVYPHRDATTAWTLAVERGYDEIAAMLQAAGARRPPVPGEPALPADLIAAVGSGDQDRIIAGLEAAPELRETRFPDPRMTPLHLAAARLWDRVAAWLLDHGADVDARIEGGPAPLEVVGRASPAPDPEKIAALAGMLLARGAMLTAPAAVLLGRGDWLRAQHAAGALDQAAGPDGGLISVAVRAHRADMLALLLELGLDPDERVRLEGVDEVVCTSAGPLHYCAGAGQLAMAELLLAHGADPNLHVYAAGPPLFQAYGARDAAMIALLERYGAIVDASTAGVLRLTEKARALLAAEAAGRLPAGAHAPGGSLAEELLFYGADGGEPEIVGLALARIDWPPEDPRWHQMLLRNLGDHPAPDRARHAACFRLILERCDPGVPGKFGRTILHDLAANWPHPASGADERVALATMVLDRGARLDVRDDLLRSTPLGWACRWGRIELVRLLLDRGADPLEAGAAPWATPRAWAEKMHRREILDLIT